VVATDSSKIELPVIIVFAVQSIVPVVARLSQWDAARGTCDALLVPAAGAHSHQEPIHDFRAAALATRRAIATITVCWQQQIIILPLNYINI